MKLVIDIPEDEYTWLKEHPNSIRWSSVYTDSILNGTPLPKRHGDLVDKNTLEGHYVCSMGIDEACVLKCDCKDCSSGVYQLYDDIDNIPVVVKADKESEK